MTISEQDVQVVRHMAANYAFERTVMHKVPSSRRLRAAAQRSC